MGNKAEISQSPLWDLRNANFLAQGPKHTLILASILALQCGKFGSRPAGSTPVPPASDQGPHHGSEQQVLGGPGCTRRCRGTAFSVWHCQENYVHLGQVLHPVQTGLGSSASLSPPPTYSWPVLGAFPREARGKLGRRGESSQVTLPQEAYMELIDRRVVLVLEVFP